MLRSFCAALVLVTCACGCFGGGSPAANDGTLDPGVLERTAEDARFQVRMPARLRVDYKLLNVGWVTGPNEHYMVNFELVAREGPILTVDEGEDSDAGVARSYT